MIINAVRRLGVEFVLDVAPAGRKPALVTARAQSAGRSPTTTFPWWQPLRFRALSAAVIWPRLLHPLGGVASMGAGVKQQGPYLRCAGDRPFWFGIALVDLDVGLVQLDVEVAGLGIRVFPGILGHIEDLMFAVAISWGNEWGNMPHRFQPTST